MEEFTSPDKKNDKDLRDSGIGIDIEFSSPPSNNLTEMSSSDMAMFLFDDIPEVSESAGHAISSTHSTPLLRVQKDSEVFHDEACGYGPRDTTACCGWRRKKSFRAQLSALDTIVTVGLQRHTNFTPPRLSPKLPDTGRDDNVSPDCPIHKRRSSACNLICKVEKEIGEGLRSVSDSYNVLQIGLNHGYHLHEHPYSCYHKAYSSSFPGAPSTALTHKSSLLGVKVRRECEPLKPHCDVQ